MKRPLVFSLDLELPEPTEDDKRADLERVADALGADSLVPTISALRTLPDILRKKGFRISPVFSVHYGSTRLIETNTGSCFALAVDIGTTNIVFELVNMKDPGPSLRLQFKNPQIKYGEDLLSRIQHCMQGGLKELRDSIIAGLNEEIKRAARQAGITTKEIYAAVFSANTVMSHLLLGLDVSHIPVSPYIPVVSRALFFTTSEVELDIHPDATVYVFPNAGSYVGGDIISGILATGLHRKESPQVLIDVGTNAEIVIGTKDWILVGAGAAGPALEGGILASGTVAKEGAIYRIDIEGSGVVKYKTIGDSSPLGICGSGVIDLVAELYRVGFIDQRGRFTDSAPTVEIDGEKTFVVAKNDKAVIGINEREIENFLRSKAAMFTSLYVLTQSLGISFRDIEKFYIAGALGSGVQLKNAQLLGMLPRLPEDRFQPIGNSSLTGAGMLLRDASLLDEIEHIHSIITYREMNTDNEFMKEFPSARFIPHTNPERLG